MINPDHMQAAKKMYSNQVGAPNANYDVYMQALQAKLTTISMVLH